MNPHFPADGLHAVRQTEQTRPLRKYGSADSIVVNDYVEASADRPNLQRNHGCVGVPSDVGEGFSHHVIRRNGNRFRQ